MSAAERGAALSARQNLSLRDYFAAVALPPVLASRTQQMDTETVAANAYAIADAMLTIRETTEVIK